MAADRDPRPYPRVAWPTPEHSARAHSVRWRVGLWWAVVSVHLPGEPAPPGAKQSRGVWLSLRFE